MQQGINKGSVIVFKPTEKRICFFDNSIDSVKLHKNELFNLLINKANLKEFKYEDIVIDKEILDIKVIKTLSDIVFEIEIKAEFATVKAALHSITSKRDISIKEISCIIENEYLFFNNSELIPISKESILFADKVTRNIFDRDKLPVLYSLELFTNRLTNEYCFFTTEHINFNEILNCNLYSGESSLFIRELYSYQKDGLKWLQYCFLNKLGGILADDMGLGKTAQIISLVAWAVERNIVSNFLIVVPSTLLENWDREFDFFAPSIRPYRHHGSQRTGSISTLKENVVVLTTYSMIVNDQYLLNKIKWGAIILDEASLIKNPQSERKISLTDLDSEVRIAMTGTPVENSLTDLWSICDFVLPGYLGNYETFCSKYTRRNIGQTLEEVDLLSLKNSISFVMLRRKKEDVLDSLPERIDIHQALQMSYQEAVMYEMERESILASIDDGNDINILTQIQNLRQFTSHPILKQSDQLIKCNVNSLIKSSTKFSRTLEILELIKLKREKVLIFTEYLKMIDTFIESLEEYYQKEVFNIDGRIATSDRQKQIDKFSKTDGFSIMILNPRTAGMGLNITAANHVIHYTRQWNPALEEQASARSYRNKQSRNVNIYYLYYIDTIEEVIDQRLRDKTSLSGEVIETTQNDLSFDDYINSLSISPINRYHGK